MRVVANNVETDDCEGGWQSSIRNERVAKHCLRLEGKVELSSLEYHVRRTGVLDAVPAILVELIRHFDQQLLVLRGHAQAVGDELAEGADSCRVSWKSTDRRLFIAALGTLVADVLSLVQAGPLDPDVRIIEDIFVLRGI